MKEALKLALDALQWSKPHEDAVITHGEAITAIKAALAQPKQEPVAWIDEEKKIIYWHNTHETDDYHGFKRTTPLYTTPPPASKPLTDEQIDEIWNAVITPSNHIREFVRAIEAAHGIKENT